MQIAMIRRIIGLLLLLYSVTVLPPLLLSIIVNDGMKHVFLTTFIAMFTGGIVLWLSSRKPLRALQSRDGFVVIVVFWVVLGFISALPFWLSNHLSAPQAFFEAVSGFTTTGATVMENIEIMPKSLLYYRQQLQFLGGLGVIVLAIAILPLLGIGGMQLQRAEASGPMREEKFAPRLTHTAKSLIILYFGLTALCALAFWVAGMSPFDALTHSYTTVSTSGFSTYNKSLGHFRDLPWIEVIAIIFMLLGSLSFSVHYMALFHRSLEPYRNDYQGKVFLYLILTFTLITGFGLYFWETYPTLDSAFRAALFQVVSLMTTTGFTTENYDAWPLFLGVLVFGSGFIGGCVGSTAGGFRVVRIVLLYKQGVREILRLIHPSAVVPLHVGDKLVSERVIEGILGFTFLYMASYLFLSLLMLAAGADIIDAFSGTAACINTIGPGLGGVSSNFSHISDAGLFISSFAMILGRLEIFALLVILSPTFWFK